MDKATKTQFSLGFFAAGIIMLFIPDLKHLDTIPIGITQYFGIMFYLGIVCVVIGYYLK
jgi:drug/metabolite transporter (DMT)-like permease